MSENHMSLAVVLGSGLGEAFSGLPGQTVLSQDLKGIHNKIIFTAEIEGNTVLFFSGRKHFYEGYSLSEITSNMDYAANLGVKNVLITNAAGGINDNFKVGDMMLINSHINLNQKLSFKPCGMPYDKGLYDRIISCCTSLKVEMKEGTYCCSSGPTYETRTEIHGLRNFGCDAVGMSTVPEAYRAKSLGINVAAISVITNLLRENDIQESDHSSIVIAAKLASEGLFSLVKSLANELN